MQATVLLANLDGTQRLAESGGEAAARKAQAKCLERLARAAQSAGGKVLRASGVEVMVLFPSADAAALAAAAMHATIDVLPAVGTTKLGVHIGFHGGPAGASGAGPSDETVRFAARLLEEARKGQTLTSRQTAAQLGSGFRSVTSRKALAFPEYDVCEVLPAPRAPSVLQLACGEQRASVSRELESVVIGRSRGCGLVVADRMASREHCTAKLHEDAFVLQDHSSNGTLVAIAGAQPVLLRGRVLPLHGAGFIVFGPQRFDDSEVVRFRCV